MLVKHQSHTQPSHHITTLQESHKTVAGYHMPQVDAVTTGGPGNACGMQEENPVHAHLLWLEEQKVQL